MYKLVINLDTRNYDEAQDLAEDLALQMGETIELRLVENDELMDEFYP